MPKDNGENGKPRRTRKSTAPAIRIEKGAVSLNWKMIVIVIAVLTGSGSIAGINLLPDGMKINGEDKGMKHAEHKVKHKEIDTKLTEHTGTLKAQGEMIGEVKNTLGAVQTVQHKQFARDEAKRATEEISNPEKRMNEYDRLVDINLKRIGRGDDPCGSINCEN
jgi:hypothetical protein